MTCNAGEYTPPRTFQGYSPAVSSTIDYNGNKRRSCSPWTKSSTFLRPDRLSIVPSVRRDMSQACSLSHTYSHLRRSHAELAWERLPRYAFHHVPALSAKILLFWCRVHAATWFDPSTGMYQWFGVIRLQMFFRYETERFIHNGLNANIYCLHKALCYVHNNAMRLMPTSAAHCSQLHCSVADPNWKIDSSNILFLYNAENGLYRCNTGSYRDIIVKTIIKFL